MIICQLRNSVEQVNKKWRPTAAMVSLFLGQLMSLNKIELKIIWIVV